jgi:hypothetical protein
MSAIFGGGEFGDVPAPQGLGSHCLQKLEKVTDR